MIQVFHAPSSSGGEYLLTLFIAEDRARLHCECKAAQNMMMCKHRLALLAGDTSKLSGDLSNLAETLAIPGVAALAADCKAVWDQVDALDAEKSRIDSKLRSLKKHLAGRVTNGEVPPQ